MEYFLEEIEFTPPPPYRQCGVHALHGNKSFYLVLSFSDHEYISMHKQERIIFKDVEA